MQIVSHDGADVINLGQPPADVDKPDAGDRQLWGCTTVLGCLDKPALLYWAAEETSTCAVDQADVVAAMAAKDREAAIDWLSGARFRRPPGKRSATQLGTDVHAACEQYALTGARPEVDAEVAPFLDQFDRWLDAFQPEYIATEVAVFSPTYGVAGTCDGFLKIDGVPYIIDYKTSRKSFNKQGKPTGPYPEAALQLACYRHAELAAVWRPRRFERFRRRYYLLSEEEQAMAVPVPPVEGGIVIHITPEHCEAYPIRCDEVVYDAFLYVLECARWQFETSQTVIGQPLQPNRREVA